MLEDAFKKRFGPKSITMVMLLSRSQKTGDTNDAYYTEMSCRFSLMGTLEHEACRAFIRGLLPALRIHVMERVPTSVD